jgi:AraC family transcriptional regulator of adaptative response / DNA-3-methyladenine glycosylase II
MESGRYLAIKARDARFDGRFFFGVTSTGVYCRPVCRVRTPRQENCRFFNLATQAEAAGFRPCLRCRPELAPAGSAASNTLPWSTQDASTILARQAAQLLDNAPNWSTEPLRLAHVAERLGVSERHMRRIFEAHWGVSPLQYLQTRRLLSAKQLLTDTRLPVAQVALLSGYGSVRRFNTVFAQQYHLQPSGLRKAITRPATVDTSSITLHLAYRPPYNVAAMLEFFHARSIAGMEAVDLPTQTISRTLAVHSGGQRYTGWVQMRFVPGQCVVQLRLSDSLAPALPLVLTLCKNLLDLDADPEAIDPVLATAFPHTEGMRVPGTVDGFELAVRAIVGQQVTVRAAHTVLTRLVQQLGEPIAVPLNVGNADKPLQWLFPSAQTLAHADPDTLGTLGLVRQRQQAIAALAQAVLDDRVELHPGVDVAGAVATLQGLPGIGDWTAQYIAMRALRWPDAFPAGDVALQKALGLRDTKNPAKAAEEASQAWRPWRSYAVLRAWGAANTLPSASASRPLHATK